MNLQTTRNAALTLPAFYLERWQTGEEMPLLVYGQEILANLQRNYPERYWQLSFEGILMKSVRERETELVEAKLFLMQELEKKFPRPKTGDFLEIAAHMNQIDEEAEKIIKKELVKPI